MEQAAATRFFGVATSQTRTSVLVPTSDVPSGLKTNAVGRKDEPEVELRDWPICWWVMRSHMHIPLRTAAAR